MAMRSLSSLWPSRASSVSTKDTCSLQSELSRICRSCLKRDRQSCLRNPRFGFSLPPGFISPPWAALVPETPTLPHASIGIIINTIIVKRNENLKIIPWSFFVFLCALVSRAPFPHELIPGCIPGGPCPAAQFRGNLSRAAYPRGCVDLT